MSKRVKALLQRDIRNRLSGADSCVVVDYRGLTGSRAVVLRRALREQGVRMLVVRNALARRALADGPLASAAPLLEGPSAICWGADDVVALARVVQENAGKDEPLTVRGASVEGRTLFAEEVSQLAALPTRLEMVAGIAARALAPARRVISLALGPAQRVLGQIRTRAEAEEAVSG